MASRVGVPDWFTGGVTGDGVGAGVGVCAEYNVGDVGVAVAVVGRFVTMTGALA